MKLHIAPSYEHLRPQLERLPELFAAGAGETLHAGRNTIRAIEMGGQRLAAKRFKRPNAFNSLVYAYLRKSKAQRAYEHAQRLRAIGIDSPEPIAWCEIRRNGVIADTYFVARYTSLRPLLDAIERYPADDSRAVLESFAAFAANLHKLGVEHKDFNSTNTIYACDAATQDYRFQLIDINRMRFHPRALSPDQGIANFQRLTGRTDAFLYILDRYAAVRGLESFATRLQGARCRLNFRYRRRLKYKLRRR